MLGSCGCAFAPTHRQESFAPTSHNVVWVCNGVPYLLQILASALELGMLRFYLTPYCRGEPDLPAGFGGNSEEGVSRHRASPLLPLNRPRWLRGDVVDDAVDAGDFVDDAVRDAGEDGEGLPELAVEPGRLDLVHHHRVGRAQHLQLLARHLADDADGQARPGEGLS